MPAAKTRRLDNHRQMRRDGSRLCDRQTIISRFLSRQPLKGHRVVRPGKRCCLVGKEASICRGYRFRLAGILLCGLLAAFAFSARAQNSGPSEYQLKAAFIYNFVKFVDWPTQAFADASSPYVIGVLGDNVFGDDLEQMVGNKVIKNRPLKFETFHSVMEVTNCQVLFISASEHNHFHQILDALRGKSILTISESDHFIDDGGMIDFKLVNRRVRFQINDKAAKKAGLMISSDLLHLALPSG